ncbi:transcriptional regulator [Microbacterium testaceum StLB037]|uniref:Transcriptional regulator n=1 Tax=Microbacterium testaceum (strain StLB037) TaxID=979556 RepID=E8NCG8_MICTS|nr:TetR/AcrR family transcriptional regulator [Microbacterium testaceum]BAJ73616.1 transcriptional regulator [Microbacterium testaceum StLB037]
MPTPRRRAARDAELLAGSVRAFAARGYFGTSTAQVAAEMGVSQPYVIRTFGSKLELFVRTHAFAAAEIVEVFRAAMTDGFDGDRLGAAYRELVLSNPAALLVWAHAFSAATAEPAIGAESRRQFDDVYRTLREAGASDAELWAFMGRGMLINNLLLMEAPRYSRDYDFAPLIDLVFGERPPLSPSPGTPRAPAPDQE